MIAATRLFLIASSIFVFQLQLQFQIAIQIIHDFSQSVPFSTYHILNEMLYMKATYENRKFNVYVSHYHILLQDE